MTCVVRCDECQTIAEPNQTSGWIQATTKTRQLDFCSWSCIEKFARAQERQSEAREKRDGPGDQPYPGPSG